jgi:hypothetical protein
MRYLVLFILLISCNPVKKVLQDKDKFDIVANEVIRRGYCVNDTLVIEKIKDSIVYKDSIVTIVDSVPCKDFDTTIGRAKIRVSSGVLTYSAKDSIVIRTHKITNTIRDRSLENILKNDISSRDIIINKLNKDIVDSEIRNKEIRADLLWWKIRFSLLCIAFGLVLFRKPIAKIITGFI